MKSCEKKKLSGRRSFTEPFTKKSKYKFFDVLSRVNLSSPKLGIVVLKKDFPLAVDRNQIKRKVRYNFIKNFNLLPNKDFLVRVKKFHLKLNIIGLKKEIERLFEDDVVK